MAEVAAVLAISPEELGRAIHREKKLGAAWERGRLLYAVGPASYGASVEETASAVGMTATEFQTLLENDPELRDHRRQLQLRLLRSATASLIAEAVPSRTGVGGRKSANVTALRELLGRISADVAGERRPPNFSALPVGQATEAIGITRETLRQWTNRGSPRNADRSVNLPAVIKWREEQLGARAKRADGGVTSEERLRQERIRKLQIENDTNRGELVPRGEMILGLLARHQILRRAFDGRPAALAEVLQGQPPAKIRQTLDREFAGISRDIISVPLDLRLNKAQQGLLDELERSVAGEKPPPAGGP